MACELDNAMGMVVSSLSLTSQCVTLHSDQLAEDFSEVDKGKSYHACGAAGAHELITCCAPAHWLPVL